MKTADQKAEQNLTCFSLSQPSSTHAVIPLCLIQTYIVRVVLNHVGLCFIPLYYVEVETFVIYIYIYKCV